LSEGRAGGTRPRLAKGISIKTTMEELAPYMRGWRGYFGFCETPEVLIALTRWVRLRLRAALWRQWKPGVAVVRP
jgi:RNA-directed DNA polymerase